MSNYYEHNESGDQYNQSNEDIKNASKRGYDAYKRSKEKNNVANSATNETLKKAIKDKAKEKAAKLVADIATGGATAVSSALIKLITILVSILLVILIVLSAIIFIIPSNIMFMKDSDVSTVHENTTDIIREAYDKNKSEVHSNVRMYLISNYGCNVVDSGDELHSENKNVICDVNIEYTPDPDTVVDSINAYASAVNGVLNTYNNKEEIQTTNFDVAYSVANEGEDKINEIASSVNENGDEYETQLSQGYAESIKNNSDDYFHPELDNSKWTKNINVQKDVIVGYEDKYVCDQYKCSDEHGKFEITCSADTVGAVCASRHKEPDYTKPIKKDIVKGVITVPVNYDISTYKKDEINNLVPIVQKNNKKENGEDYSEQDAYEMIQEMLYTQYSSYLEIMGITGTDGVFAGVNSIFYKKGIEGWDGDAPSSKFNYESYAKNNYQEIIWNHIENGLKIGHGTRQCTNLVSAYLYDTYGLTGALGNGQDYVASLVNDHGWQLLDTPAPGCVFSSSASIKYPYGHTGVVLWRHGENIAVLEANQDGNGRIDYRVMTVDELTKRYTSQNRYIKFAAP